MQETIDDLKNKVVSLSGERGWALSCYFPVFNVLTCTLVSVKMVNSHFCRFHARQGYVLFATWFLTIVVALVSETLSLMLWGVVLLLHISGAVIAFSKKEGQIPLIGQIAERIPEFYVFTFLTGKQPDEMTSAPPEKPVETAESVGDGKTAKKLN